MIRYVLDNYELIAPIANGAVRCDSDTVVVWPYRSWSIRPSGVPHWLTRVRCDSALYSWDSKVRESWQR